jgi:hypothetical protein
MEDQHDIAGLSKGLLEAQELYCKKRIETGKPCADLRKQVELYEAKLREAVTRAEDPLAPMARTLLAKQEQFRKVWELSLRRGTRAYYCEFEAWQDAAMALRKVVGLPAWSLTLKKVPKVFS